MKFKLLGIIFVVLAGAAAVSLIYYWQVSYMPIPEPIIHKDATASWKTYMNNAYKFEVKYPNEYSLDESSNQNGADYNMNNAIQVVRVAIPKSFYPKTNFAEGWMSVEVGNKMTQVSCGKYLKNNSQAPLEQKETINGIEYGKTEFSGAAAGNLYDTRLYRVFRNSLCYEVSLNIHTTNIGNYEPGVVTAVDEIAIWKQLNAVLQTFKFTDSATVFCGGLAGTECPTSGYICKSEGSFPDAGTTCIKIQTTGTLTGHADVGPICPVEQLGHPCTTPPEAYIARQVGVFTQVMAMRPQSDINGILVASQHLDANGNYRFDLAPGTYDVKASGMQVDQLTSFEGTVIIKAGQTSKLDFTIDTGIR